MAPPRQKPHRSRQDYSTPDNFIKAVKQRLGIKEFAFDFAADPTNCKARDWWGIEDDALSQSPHEWAFRCGRGRWGFLNPEFAHIDPWARACYMTKQLRGQVAFLVPAAVGANWFRDWVHGKALVLALNGRLAFMPDKPKWLYPKDTMLCLYSPDIEPGFDIWEWRKKAL